MAASSSPTVSIIKRWNRYPRCCSKKRPAVVAQTSDTSSIPSASRRQLENKMTISSPPLVLPQRSWALLNRSERPESMLARIRELIRGRGSESSASAKARDTNTAEPKPTIRWVPEGRAASITVELKKRDLMRDFYISIARARPTSSSPMRPRLIDGHSSRSSSRKSLAKAPRTVGEAISILPPSIPLVGRSFRVLQKRGVVAQTKQLNEGAANSTPNRNRSPRRSAAAFSRKNGDAKHLFRWRQA